MNLNRYETVCIVKPDITELDNIALINDYKSLIKSKGGQNIKIQHCGRRHLSYNISRYYDGFYIQVNYESSGELVKAIEKKMRFDDHVLRYLTIKKT